MPQLRTIPGEQRSRLGWSLASIVLCGFLLCLASIDTSGKSTPTPAKSTPKRTPEKAPATPAKHPETPQAKKPTEPKENSGASPAAPGEEPEKRKGSLPENGEAPGDLAQREAKLKEAEAALQPSQTALEKEKDGLRERETALGTKEVEATTPKTRQSSIDQQQERKKEELDAREKALKAQTASAPTALERYLRNPFVIGGAGVVFGGTLGILGARLFRRRAPVFQEGQSADVEPEEPQPEIEGEHGEGDPPQSTTEPPSEDPPKPDREATTEAPTAAPSVSKPSRPAATARLHLEGTASDFEEETGSPSLLAGEEMPGNPVSSNRSLAEFEAGDTEDFLFQAIPADDPITTDSLKRTTKASGARGTNSPSVEVAQAASATLASPQNHREAPPSAPQGPAGRGKRGGAQQQIADKIGRDPEGLSDRASLGAQPSEGALAKMSAEHEAELESLRLQYQGEFQRAVSRLKKRSADELKQAEQNRENELVALREQHASAIATLKQRTEAERQAQQGRIEAAVAALNEQHARVIRQIETQAQAAEQGLRAEAARQSEEARLQHQRALEEEKERAQRSLAEQEAETTRLLQTLEESARQHELDLAEWQQREAAKAARIASLDGKLGEVHNELEKTQGEKEAAQKLAERLMRQQQQQATQLYPAPFRQGGLLGERGAEIDQKSAETSPAAGLLRAHLHLINANLVTLRTDQEVPRDLIARKLTAAVAEASRSMFRFFKELGRDATSASAEALVWAEALGRECGGDITLRVPRPGEPVNPAWMVCSRGSTVVEAKTWAVQGPGAALRAEVDAR
jgi:hypothetical protein